MRKLTGKQERFALGLAAGMSQRAAYRAAYDCQRSSDKTVDNKASKLFARDEVRARYDEVIARVAEEAAFDRARAARELTAIVEIGLAHIRRSADDEVHYDGHGRRDVADLPRGSATAVIAAIDKLCKLLGLYDEATSPAAVVVIIDDVT